MSSSNSSSLSSAPPSDVEAPPSPPKATTKKKTLKLDGGKLLAATRDVSSSPEPPPPPREPSPPHEYVLADNPDIAVLVMFRARFHEVFPKNIPDLGPQDIENGVVDTLPSEQVEYFLCALLGLVLNRKKPIERGHHGRALEEAISTHKNQWPRMWGNKNPLPGTRTFADMEPRERLGLLKTLTLWALNSSEAIITSIKESYKQSRRDDDINQPRSVQPWGSDGRKRQYWLVEGLNDTPFRLYRESPPKLINKTWWSVAGTIEELKTVAEELISEGSQAARRLADRIKYAIPRLEAGEEKRKRREYRLARRAAFSKPEPGFSLYEGRTRGKRMKYTFSDEEDYGSDAPGTRKSNRVSNGTTPTEASGPTVTASGRQVRSRFGRSYGEPLQDSREDTLTGDEQGVESFERSLNTRERPRRNLPNTGYMNGTSKLRDDGYDSEGEMSDDEDSAPSGEEWGGDDNDIEGKFDMDEDDSMGGNDVEEDDDSLVEENQSLVVRLKYHQGGFPPKFEMSEINGNSETPKKVFQEPSTTSKIGHAATPSDASLVSKLQDPGAQDTAVTNKANSTPYPDDTLSQLKQTPEYSSHPQSHPSQQADSAFATTTASPFSTAHFQGHHETNLNQSA